MSLLGDILENKRTEIASLRATPRTPGSHLPLDAVSALRREAALRLVGEVKLRSPSAGPLSRVLAPPARALSYARAGAAMVSVLCDGPFFGGAWSDLSGCRAAFDAARMRVPLLAKEFVLDERQIEEARDRGADAVLLIVRVLRDHDALTRLVSAAKSEGIEPLVEVVDEDELRRALDAGARVVGVNARDLDSLAMDASRASRVLDRIPSDVVAVHLSGLKTAADVSKVALGRSDAALIGEALMRQDDPSALLSELIAAAAALRAQK